MQSKLRKIKFNNFGKRLETKKQARINCKILKRLRKFLPDVKAYY